MASQIDESKLTMKQKAWLVAYLTPGSLTYFNGTASAEAAGYRTSDKKSLAVIGTENLIKLKPLVNKWLDEVGMSPERIKGLIAEGMTCTETKFFQHEGVVTDEREVIPWGVRKSFYELAAKVKGILEPDRLEVKVRVEDYNQIKGEEEEALKDASKFVRQKLIEKARRNHA